MGGAVKTNKGKWIRAAILAAVFVGLIVFLFTRGNGNTARYTDGVNGLKLGDETYELVTDIATERYIGSQVRDVIRGVRGEQVAVVKSFGITIAALYRLEGDSDDIYLTDGNDRIYCKKERAEAARAALADTDKYFNDFRITDAAKTIEGMRKIPIEQATALREFGASGEGKEMTVTDKNVVTDYDNRREIFAFSNDGLFRHPVMELFLYNNEVYLTTGFEGDRDVRKDQVLKGVRIPDELQEAFAAYWK